MAGDGPALVMLTLGSVGLLLFLILAVRMHAFVALLAASIALGLASGMDPVKVVDAIRGGMGGTLGSIAVILALGAMIGRFVEHSGGGRALAGWFLRKFGRDRASWAVLTGAFIVGLPIFFDVAFIILAPILWNLARESKKSILLFGLPVAAALTVTHALVPPHPAPAAAAAALGADLGKVILYGIAVSVPMAIVGGIMYGGWIARRMFVPVPEIAARFAADSGDEPHRPPPSVPLVLAVLLLPIALIFAGTLAGMFSLPAKRYWQFFGDPVTALALALLVAVLSMGFRRGLGRDAVTRVAGESLGPICSLLLITGAGGSFKQVITESGVGLYAGNLMAGAGISPLVVAYLIAGLLRIAQGSATVAIITAAGIVAPIVQNMSGYSPEILVLAIACGGTMLSHVNDSGFWIVNQYLGLTVPQTLRTWTVMKVIVSVVGFALVLAAQALLG